MTEPTSAPITDKALADFQKTTVGGEKFGQIANPVMDGDGAALIISGGEEIGRAHV